MKFIFKFAKRFVFGAFLLYGFNLISVSFNMIIPINIYTVSTIGLLGVPALFALFFIKFFGL